MAEAQTAEQLEARIRAKAYELWEGEGRPEGREASHWEQARVIIALEDTGLPTIPLQDSAPKPEPAKLMENLGEFPSGYTDQGDEQQFPAPPKTKLKPPASKGRR